MYLIESIGDYSVEFTQIISILCLLYVNPYLIIFYIIGFFINTWINNTLKKWLGGSMPSGHFQKMAYSISFVGFVLLYKNALSLYWKYIIGAYVLALSSYLYNCLIHEYHSVSEIIVGSGLGTIMGYAVYLISRKITDK
jgi:membrane-associated phospholipid phosphatase